MVGYSEMAFCPDKDLTIRGRLSDMDWQGICRHALI